jgi:beta-lactamase regulating signal transducer with metallopeptidase domain
MTFTAYQGWWCVGQITLLTILACVTTGIWLRRRPAASARVASAATGMILAVTLLALAPFPQRTFWHRSSHDVSGTGPAATAIPTSESTPAMDLSPAMPGFRVIELYNAFAGSVRATVRYPASHGMSGWIGAFATVCTAIGFARLMWALTYLKRIRRESIPIASERVAHMAKCLASSLEVTQRYELRQCACLLSPAVIGWRRPTILIPSAWPSWSDDQLQAALAHELAHISRGDSLTRLMAACATTLHFYHPFVHWLAARLSLSQELAADRLAAAATGDERRYLCAISQLAIWLDEQSGLRAEPLVLPAFSSNLIRRIKMLRAMDCKYDKERPHRRTVVVVALLALVTLFTTALRGNAEDPTPSIEKPKTMFRSTESANCFSRPAFDFSILGDNKLGAYVIRVSDIVEQPALRALLETHVLPTNEQIKKQWAEEFGHEVPPPDLDLDAIDYIAGVGNLTIRPIRPGQVTTPGTTDTFMLGTPETIVHFKQPVAWKEWIHYHFPASVEKSVAGVSYVELPVIKAVGPEPLCVVARDAQTVVLLTGMGPDLPGPDAIASAANPAPRPAKSQLAARWAELDGGLVTFVATDREVKPSKPTTPDKVLTKKVLDASRLLGWAFDIDARTREAHFRVQLTCDNSSAAREVQGILETAIALAKVAAVTSDPSATINASAANGKTNKTAQELDTHRFQSELISSIEVSLWQQADGAAGILVETTATIPGYATTAVTAAREKLNPK